MSSITKNPITWKGYGIASTKDYKNFSVRDFEPKKADDYDIDIAISHCGVCASDHHTISGGWGPVADEHLIAGHEVVGKVVKVGSKVSSIKEGDRVAVGAQVCSCFECNNCKNDNENYCPNGVDTYNAKYPNGDLAHGGYSAGIRVHERFVFPLPEALKSEDAAPMACAGLTVYSPIVRNGTGPGKRVAVLGLGGLGHFAVQWIKALGAEAVVFSHSPSKKEDALKLGATDFVDTSKKDFEKPWAGKIDLIISTASSTKGLDLNPYISTLVPQGKLVYVGMPEESLGEIKSQQLAGNGAFIGSSHIGSKKEALAMYKLAADKGVKPMLLVLPMKEAGKAIQLIEDNKQRYRTVLVQDIVDY
ncbi:uncharacterized protein L969DRAFT_87055 [Mixia osmundae IAM 14324]|uniref:Enoyl reductase (ER) domain-containing protein n=1 Tax=Mixia osmundae (strain CBS 9802 / IAM 14324 / JCM 22182 / KY 12970) TaxID=764103 RepID=G7E6H7_MIXOS|nr:uncharacterized protein L969DRAFT_87055 [Mixia osmundae IAM 14324]KEI40406.1 hypothetical protein L969DRAFT_87055 [Mixia osmundae IAM 14324]GAA98437.1 hypothetical protein E5Q_05123 [Mixia osmundae IAM 14324]